MISIIITSFKEPKTIGRAIESFLNQELTLDYELIVVAPDDQTINVAKEYSKKDSRVKTLKDRGAGKSAALNLVVSKAKGDILVLTDGDVSVGNDSLRFLLEPFKDKQTGAVTGRPVSTSPVNTKYGYWASILTEVAHERRLKATQYKKRFFCSGYLFAIRKKLFPELPENLLSEDGYISHKVYEAGYKIGYSPSSRVYVKYPSTFSDWIKQKKRSAGGYNQLREMLDVEIRSFKKESFGSTGFFRYVKSLKEIIWLAELFFARVYLWYLIYRDINLRKKTHADIWQRVESTK